MLGTPKGCVGLHRRQLLRNNTPRIPTAQLIKLLVVMDAYTLQVHFDVEILSQGTGHQRHKARIAYPCAQATYEQPILAPFRNPLHQSLDLIVVDRKRSIGDAYGDTLKDISEGLV